MQRKDLTRSLAEVVLIMVSVLLAFAAQAQWEGRQERRQRAAHIDAVIAELEVNREVVRTHLELTQGADSAALRMVEIAYGDVPRPSSEIINETMWVATSIGPFRASTLAIAELMRSPFLSEIEDPELPARLASLQESFSGLEVQSSIQERFWLESLDPYLRSRIDYRAWSGTGR
jgi:hypothetical protein